MLPIIRYTLLTAFRDWLFIGVLLFSLVAIALSLFLGSTALVEEAHMSIAYAAGSIRLILVTGLILFVCVHVRRCFDNKEIEQYLSRPVSRGQFVVAYWLGFVILTVVISLPVFAIVGTLSMVMMTKTSLLALLFWCSSLLAEIFLIVAFALVSALIMRSAVSAILSCFAFYIMSRMMGFFIAAQAITAGEGKGLGATIMDYMLQAISIVMPRLDLYGKSTWLIYGIGDAATIWVYQSLIYIPLLLAMAVTDFRRKQF